ncbi:MAG: hypothetical protein WBX01_01985 [Nitrososphaeraceae archaeon]
MSENGRQRLDVSILPETELNSKIDSFDSQNIHVDSPDREGALKLGHRMSFLN